MIERTLRGVRGLVATSAMLWVTSHNYASAEEAAADVSHSWTQGLGSTYLFGFLGGVIMFFALMLLKMRDDKPKKEGAK